LPGASQRKHERGYKPGHAGLSAGDQNKKLKLIPELFMKKKAPI
jgi:hypothetical protein